MRGSHDRRRPAAKVAVGLTVALLVVAAASYAAVGPSGGGREHRDAGASGKPTTIPVGATTGSASLRIVDHPHTVTIHHTARFRVLAAGEPTLRCRLDQGRAQPCAASVVYRHLRAGDHRFLVAARGGRRTVRADFGWRVIEPMPFEVEPRPAEVGPLFPGAAPLPIRVVITNPNPVAISVTALRVGASGGAPACDPATNLALTSPDLGAARLRIPAHGSLTLPSATVPAPTIALRELAVDQDACQGASFDLSFTGSAGA
ncbi:MAG TPA: hypothetical protein VHZ54_04165 [Solirubrobacterales bacterium]|nr:hypothetical protein [Solirubrobacterales bacterium]